MSFKVTLLFYKEFKVIITVTMSLKRQKPQETDTGIFSVTTPDLFGIQPLCYPHSFCRGILLGTPWLAVCHMSLACSGLRHFLWLSLVSLDSLDPESWKLSLHLKLPDVLSMIGPASPVDLSAQCPWYEDPFLACHVRLYPCNHLKTFL